MRFGLFLIGILCATGCSNAPLAGTLDTLFPSRPALPRDNTIRPDPFIPGPAIPDRPKLPDPDLPGRRLPPLETIPDRPFPERSLPELRPLDDIPRSGDLIAPPPW